MRLEVESLTNETSCALGIILLRFDPAARGFCDESRVCGRCGIVCSVCGGLCVSSPCSKGLNALVTEEDFEEDGIDP